MTAEEYTREKGGVKHVHFEPNDDIYIREDDVYRLMESYRKESSKELVEALLMKFGQFIVDNQKDYDLYESVASVVDSFLKEIKI